MHERIYLDHAAITPVFGEARDAVIEMLEHSGNPSSPHSDGRLARAALEQSRRAIAKMLNWRHDVILTSGGSEALAIASARSPLLRRIVGATEHEAALAAMGENALVVPVGPNGEIDLDALKAAVAEGPALVSIQFVNNETGVIQPLEPIYEIVKSAGSLLLSDCAQAAGKIALPDSDFLAITSQKFGAMTGSGALLVKNLGSLRPSGGQERGYRRGTENLPGSAAMAAALSTERFKNAAPRLASLRRSLEEELGASGAHVIAVDAQRIATIGAYAMPGVASAAQLVQFDLAGISISAGSACSSGSMKTSRVLRAMGIPEDVANSVIRVSFGPSTSEGELDRFLTEWRRIRNHAKVRAA